MDHDSLTEKNAVKDGVLYLVATPIGNLSDISYRAVKILGGVSFIAAEDTRNTMKLLRYLGIQAELTSYYEHNKREKGEVILERLIGGESCALVTDAGTPAISDPGEDLVRLCAEHGVEICAVPGCCAAVNALALSGLPTRRFVFEGFLPYRKQERRERFSEWKTEPRTLILYEAPHKLRETLKDLYESLGDRKIALCREITKLNEEVIRTTLENAVSLYQEKEPRGEYVLVIEGAVPTEAETADAADVSPAERVAALQEAGMSRMEAIKTAARERNMTKSELYAMLCREKETRS